MTHDRIRRGLVLPLVAALGLAACGSGSGDDAVAIPAVFDLDHDPAASVSAVDPDRTNVLPAGALRGALEDALTWHGITLVQVMRAARTNAPGLHTWIDALTANTDAITGAGPSSGSSSRCQPIASRPSR